MADRERVGREASPSGAIIGQSVKRPRLVAPAATMRARRSRGQAPRAGRHRRARSVLEAHPANPGPRWWRAAAVRLTRLVSGEGLCRQRLRRREGRHGHRDRRRDHAQKPRSGRLRRPTAPLGRGALLRLDQPQPATQRTSRPPSPRPAPSSTPPPSCSSSADWPEPHDFRNRLLALSDGRWRKGRLPGKQAVSEYQSYEFQAIDRPLGEADMEALRTLSTRAQISATSFTNHYKWGDFQGDPNRLIGRSRLDPFRRGCAGRRIGRTWSSTVIRRGNLGLSRSRCC